MVTPALWTKMASNEPLKKTFVLAIGQTIGYGFQLALPFFLSRYLSVEGYGTFRQVTLLQWFFLSTLHMGMNNTLFNFVGKAPEDHGVYSLNTMLSSLVSAVICGGLLVIFRNEIGALLNNPELPQYLPWFALYLVFAAQTQQLENYLLVLDKVTLCSVMTFFNIALPALAVISGYWFFASLKAVLLMFLLFEMVKVFLLCRFNWRHLDLSRHQRWFFAAAWREQWQFSYPLGISNIINFFLQMDRFIVSAFYSVQQFASYAVGCFDIPVVPFVVNNIHDFMSIDMIRALRANDYEALADIWREAMRLIVLLTLPLLVYFAFFAEDVITFVFSETYRDSAHYFRVFVFTLVIGYCDPEVIFRVFPETDLFMKQQLAFGSLSLVGILLGAYAGVVWGLGPMGALLAKLIIGGAGLLVRLAYCRRFLRLSWRAFIYWRHLGLMIVICLLAIAAALAIHELLPSRPFVILATTFPCYLALVFGLSAMSGAVRKEETAWLLGRFKPKSKSI